MRSLEQRLEGADKELTELKATSAETRRKLTVFTKEQRKEQERWAARGGEMLQTKKRRIELEIAMYAKHRDFDSLAVENQELRRQLEVAASNFTPANLGL